MDQKVRPPHIVDQDIQAILLALDARYQRLNLNRVQMIDLQGNAAAAGLLHQLGRLFNRFRTAKLGSLRARRSARAVHRSPATPSSTAMPRPAPRVAPATNATLPFSA
jgi:hypothetical protein